MSTFISEISYAGGTPSDFLEVAAPKGTDVTGYTLQVYNASGSLTNTLSFGAITQTVDQKDVYVFDNALGFPNLSGTDAFAVVDDQGNVLQFISVDNNTVTAVDGDAAGLTATNAGSADSGNSLQSDDGGSSYYNQSSPNAGTIPCYAPGMLITTPQGPRPVEALAVGDLVDALDHGPQPIRWLRMGEQPLEAAAPDARPVMIRKDALGPGCPARDLVVSPQHRILVGGQGQLAGAFPRECFAPAKALTDLPGIRFMQGKRRIVWHHFALARHAVVSAEACAAESLLLGPMVLCGLGAAQRRRLALLFGPAPDGAALNGPPARPCLTVAEARRLLQRARLRRPPWRPARSARAA